MTSLLNPWILLGLLVALLAAFGSGFTVSKHYAETECASGQVQAERAAVSQAAAETTRRETIGAARETSREQIRVVYRTIREQANAIQVDSGSAGVADCGLDADGLRIWNAANSGIPAPLPGEPDYRLPAPSTGKVGGLDGLAEQPHRSYGAVRAVPGSDEQTGGVRQAGVTE